MCHIHRIAAGSMHSVALLGDSNQLANMAHNFYIASDMLTNPWTIDLRGLDQKPSTEDSISPNKRIN